MKQVIQDFKTGDLFVDDVPPPSISSGFVLVRNHFSLISAGTERSTVSAGKASLLGKAKQRPDLVKQVLMTYKKEGFYETFKRVQTKLATLKELGYSSAGTVLLSMDTKGLFKPGDRVACGGGGASHSGIIAVPQNLIVKLPDQVSFDQAAFTTLGSIALQGVRQAESKLGEFVCVIGLGLLGQITAQILRSNGCQVFGIDTSETMVELGRKISCHHSLTRKDPALISAIESFTEGHGFDSVIITAATKSNDPIDFSTEVLRQKGIIVVVGAAPMNIQREPYFYKKELTMKISCSYGPGRYDTNYEEGGIDYPYGYVRWTENRNMSAFVKLLEHKSVDVKSLVTHVFKIENAEKAYDLITGKTNEHYIAILLKYPDSTISESSTPLIRSSTASEISGIGFIGAGSFAQKFLIPVAAQFGQLAAVVTSRGVTAKSVGEKYEFKLFSTNHDDILKNEKINTIFIATRHKTHAELVLKALEAGKNVFVEKPLAIYEDDLKSIANLVKQRQSCRLMVGFNRRFAPLAIKAKELFQKISGPLVINYRVNAGFIPNDHWIQTDEGGGRILGEVCHFVDFLQFIAGANPVKVFAECVSAINYKMKNQDNLIITIRFANGTIGSISYFACGEKNLSKERIEISGGGNSFIIDDFRFGESYSQGIFKKIKLPGKGHNEEIKAFFKSIKEGIISPIPFESIYYTTATTFRIIDSLQSGLAQDVALDNPAS